MRTLSYNSGSDFRRIIQGLAREFSGHEVRFVVPSRKDKCLLPGHDERGIWTWQDIYEDIIPPANRRQTLSPPDHLLILRRILDGSLSRHPEKVSLLPGLKRPGFLTVLSSDIREMLNEAVTPDLLRDNPESNNPAEFLLPEIYREYLHYLAGYNLLDSAQIYSAAYEAVLANQEWGKSLVMIFAGFLSFNHSQLQLVQAIRDRCRDTVIIKPEANMAGFHDAGIQLGEQEKASSSSGRLLEIPSAEPGLEPEIIARTLALWSAGKWEEGGKFPGFDAIGLMTDEGREEAFAEAFARYGVPFTFMDGVMISATLSGRIIPVLHALNARNFPAYGTAVLLTYPCFAGSKFPVMDAYRAGRSGLDNWITYLKDDDGESHGIFHTALIAVEAAGKFCSFMEEGHTPAQIMAAYNDFLHTPGLWLERDDDISGFPELDESMRLTASAIETVNEKVTALRELLPDLGEVKDDTLKGDDAYSFLEDWCRNSHVRAPIQLSNSVRIFAGNPPVLSSFPVWIMAGITQKSWSPNEKASPLLGNDERISLNDNGAFLPRTKEKAQQREALFRRLVMTGENLTIISRPLLDDEGRTVSESPFVQKFRDDMKGWDCAETGSEGIGVLVGYDGFTFPEIDAGERVRRYVPCVKYDMRNVGASDIQELLECPFLWYQHRQALLYQPSYELVPEYEWGKMLHAYWESVWRIYRDDMAAPGSKFVEAAKSEWDKLLQTTQKEDEPYGKFRQLVRDSRFSRRLEAVAFRASRLAGVQAEILDLVHKDYAHERILLEDEARLVSASGGITFTGQCDRIEILRGHDGGKIAFITDYKEGHGSSSNYDKGMDKLDAKSWHKDGEPGKFAHGLQLSLYAAMFRGKWDCDLRGVYILGHEDGKISGTFSADVQGIFAGFSDKTDTDIQGRYDEGEYAVRCAVRILKTEEYLPDYESERCKHCHIKSICRKGEFKGEITEDGD